MSSRMKRRAQLKRIEVVKHRIVKNPGRVFHVSRTLFETISCGFVAIETHIPIFTFFCVLWAVVDLVSLAVKDVE